MRVILTEEAKRDLKRLDRKIANRIANKFFWFGDNFNAHMQKSLGGQFRGLYKLRIGDWRALYDFKDDVITVHLIDHRSNIYKRR